MIILHILCPILFLSMISSIDGRLNEFDLDDPIAKDTFTMSKSTSINNTHSTPSLISFTLPTEATLLNDELTSLLRSPTTRNRESMKSLVDQINAYRNKHILARVRQCDRNIKLDEICEMYAIDNQTNSLIHQADADLPTPDDLSADLLDQSIVKNLKNLCLSTNWCLKNISKDEIQLIKDIIQQRGHMFCSIEQCESRLKVLINSCPTIANTNISIPTLKLSPMLCSLHTDQLSWNSSKCTEEIVYLLYRFYAFWPQFERCFFDVTTDLDGCDLQCRRFDNILTKLEQQCNGNASFLSRVPALAWSRSTNLEKICHEKSNPDRPAFIHSMTKFLSSSQQLWPQSYQKPLYIILFTILLIFLVISFSLCFCTKSKYRRVGDDYEYTRLQDSTFELGANSEIPNGNSTVDGSNDAEPQFESNNRIRTPERQRLLFVNP